MDGAHIGSAAPGGMLTADRVWVRWGVTAWAAPRFPDS